MDDIRAQELQRDSAVRPANTSRGRPGGNPTPLINLLGNITPLCRSQILRVRLNHRLGYLCDINFGSAELLYRWLTTGNPSDVGSSTSLRDRNFVNPLPLSVFLANVSSCPSHIQLVDGQSVVVPPHQKPRRAE